MRRALIAEDHPIYLNGIKLVLSFELDFQIEEARSGVQALDLLEAQRFDLLVIDLDLPEMSGIDVIASIRRRLPLLPILAVSGLRPDVYAAYAIDAGATAFIPKNAEKDDFVAAVREVLRPASRTKPAGRSNGAAEGRDEEAKRYLRLSKREFEVFGLIAAGKTVGEIARELHRSTKTISAQRASVLKKLELHNNAQLMRYALKHGIVALL